MSSHDSCTASTTTPSPRKPYLIEAAMERARVLAANRQEMRGAQVHSDEISTDSPQLPSIESSSMADSASLDTKKRKRKLQLQHVSTKQDKLAVLKWMIAADKVDSKYLFKRTIAAFPECFRADSDSANYMKASRWWKDRQKFIDAFSRPENRMSVQALQPGTRKHVMLKALPGRGRKRDPWTDWLHLLLQEEFHRLRKAGLKLAPTVLVSVAKYLLADSNHETYCKTFVPPGKEIPFYEQLNVRWIQTFQERFNIVQRKQCGKKQLSPQKELQIEREVAFHKGILMRGFDSGEFTDTHMANMDETHFIIDMDNGRTLNTKGTEHIQYADVVSGTTGMTMVVLIEGGSSAKIGVPMMIFVNADGNYPIRGVPDNIPGVTYRTAPKGFMTSSVFAKWLGERRVNRRRRGTRKMILWADNYSGHGITEAAKAQLEELNIDLRFFPANATHLVQPADSFVISIIKDAWTKRWNEKKVEMIRNEQWQNNVRRDGSWSGALQNPGKRFYLQLAADSVRDVNAQITAKDSISYAQKAMIRCGLACKNGKWSVSQLSNGLQYIIEKHYQHFMGKPANEAEDEDRDSVCGQTLEAVV